MASLQVFEVGPSDYSEGPITILDEDSFYSKPKSSFLYSVEKLVNFLEKKKDAKLLVFLRSFFAKFPNGEILFSKKKGVCFLAQEVDNFEDFKSGFPTEVFLLILSSEFLKKSFFFDPWTGNFFSSAKIDVLDGEYVIKSSGLSHFDVKDIREDLPDYERTILGSVVRKLAMLFHFDLDKEITLENFLGKISFISPEDKEIFRSLIFILHAKNRLNLAILREKLRCPINGKLMIDAVKTSDGNIYSKEGLVQHFRNIESYREKGITLSPFTLSPLENFYFMPNVEITEKIEKTLSEIEIPSNLICPLGKGIMKNPVTASDGWTYSRAAIEKYFQKFAEEGKEPAPIFDGFPFKHLSLFPNAKTSRDMKQFLFGHPLLKDISCPISGELFEDPVIASDGHTYSRKSFEKYLEGNYVPSPVGGAITSLYGAEVFVRGKVEEISLCFQKLAQRAEELAK